MHSGALLQLAIRLFYGAVDMEEGDFHFWSSIYDTYMTARCSRVAILYSIASVGYVRQ